MTRAVSTIVLSWILLIPAAVSAGVEVQFIEDAPKDRFQIVNRGACTLEDLELVIDLGPSAGRLYFDTTGTGAGVQVFQPFEVAAGTLRLVPGPGASEQVVDGQDALRLQVTRLAAGARAAFTIDVDDALVGGAMGPSRVAGAEIAGARIAVIGADEVLEARFDDGGRALTPALPCVDEPIRR